MAGTAPVALDRLFAAVGASARDLFGVASFARFATRCGEGEQGEKKEERNPRTELRPSLRLTEPGGEKRETQYQKDDAKGNPHDQPGELLILQGVETGTR